MDKLAHLKEIVSEIEALNEVTGLLSWDQQVVMPRGAAEGRGYQSGTLSAMAHRLFTSDEMGHLLEDLRPLAVQMDPDADDARLIRLVDREFQKRTRVPASYVAEFSQVTAVAQPVWEQARAKSDFALFRPHLERVVELRRQYASFFAPYAHVYDPLLDDFEPGLKTAEVQQIFNTLRAQQVELIRAITAARPVRNDFLLLEYPEQTQWDFGVDVITCFGYDWNHGRLDRSVHPFTQGAGMDDVRITTRFETNRVASAMFGTMHECGHALYDLGIDPAYKRSIMGGATSLAVHESQSRLWENLVGRSREFWTGYYPHFQSLFPEQVGNVDLDTFYKGINKVEPSLIRVEADEATYNLHIMLRLELEIALMDGTLAVKDLPQAWNELFKEYLGLTPPNDALGVLQDVHWSGGMIGYFPTYALGNLISVQLWEKILQEHPDLPDQLSKGEFSTLLQWLRQKVHRHGAKYESQELVLRATGSKIDPQPYLRYLRNKYSKIYGL
ncbi:MAG TPA: carboxypeptidase M32 [Anaerolineaceae bacterium]|nr:carboxypeptidase M32 [Anaerolineaceae bacterium]